MTTRFLTAAQISAHILKELPDLPSLLTVYWVEASGHKRRLAAEIEGLCVGEPVVAFALGGEPLFRNANALNADAIRVLNACREKVLEREAALVSRGGLALVIVAATALDVPPLPSFEQIPEWFPSKPMHEVDVAWRDLNQETRVPLNSQQLGAREIARDLYYLDVAVTESLHHAATRCPGDPGLMHDLTRVNGGKLPRATWQELLEASAIQLRGVSNPFGYRPEARDFIAPSEWALKLVTETKPLDLGKVGANLCSAMNLHFSPGDHLPLSLTTRIAHSAHVKTFATREMEFGQGLIILLHSAAHLLMLHAHSGEYLVSSPAVLAGITADLCGSLQDCALAIEGHRSAAQ
jgi:hypothetical protein